jgi:hypothetical protein
VSRSVFLGAPVDTPWSDDDRAWARALLDVEAAVCGGCGHDMTQSLDAESEGAYRASVLRCHACAAKARYVDSLPESMDRAGLQVRAVRKG